MQIILTATYCLLFLYVIRKLSFFRTDGIPVWMPGVVFFLKCISGILLGLIYTYYYTNHQDADSFKFFTDSKYMFDALYTKPYDFFRMFTGFDSNAPELRPYYLKMDAWLNTNPIFNDNKTIVRLNTFFRFFSLGYYYVHVIFINAISFTGLFCIFRSFIVYAPSKKTELFFLTFLLPSVMFWGSGLLKDGLLIGGFGIFLYAFVRIIHHGLSVKRMIALIAGAWILFMTKVYVIAIILPGIFAWWIARNSNGTKAVIIFLLSYIIYLGIGFNIYRFDPDINLAAEIFYKQKNFIEFAEQHSATMITLPRIECSGISVLQHAPHALSNTLFRPFLTDYPGNPLILLASVENLFIMLLILLCLISIDMKKNKTNAFVMFNLAFILLLFVLIGLSSPVLGAIVRYKIIALPSLMFVCLYYYDRGRLIRRLPFLRFLSKIKS